MDLEERIPQLKRQISALERPYKMISSGVAHSRGETSKTRGKSKAPKGKTIMDPKAASNPPSKHRPPLAELSNMLRKHYPREGDSCLKSGGKQELQQSEYNDEPVLRLGPTKTRERRT